MTKLELATYLSKVEVDSRSACFLWRYSRNGFSSWRMADWELLRYRKSVLQQMYDDVNEILWEELRCYPFLDSFQHPLYGVRSEQC